MVIKVIRWLLLLCLIYPCLHAVVLWLRKLPSSAVVLLLPPPSLLLLSTPLLSAPPSPCPYLPNPPPVRPQVSVTPWTCAPTRSKLWPPSWPTSAPALTCRSEAPRPASRLTRGRTPLTNSRRSRDASRSSSPRKASLVRPQQEGGGCVTNCNHTIRWK